MKKKIILISFLLIVWVGIGLVVFHFVRNTVKENDNDSNSKKSGFKVKDELVVESGDKLPAGEDYFEKKAPKNIEIEYYRKGVLVSEQNSSFYYKKGSAKITRGTYTFDVELKGDDGITYHSKIVVKDETKPKVIVQDVTVDSYTKYDVSDFIKSYSDNSGDEEYVTEFISDIKKDPGTYKMKFKVCDKSENCVEEEANLEIVVGSLKVGIYDLQYGMYTGTVCDIVLGKEQCSKSTIYLKGNKFTLNDGTEKTYIVSGNAIILSNGEAFKVVDDNKMEYQNEAKSIYEFRENSLS